MDLDGLKLGRLWLVAVGVDGGCCRCNVFGFDASEIRAEVLEESSFDDWLKTLESIDFFGTFAEASFEFVDNRWIGGLSHCGLLALQVL